MQEMKVVVEGREDEIQIDGRVGGKGERKLDRERYEEDGNIAEKNRYIQMKNKYIESLRIDLERWKTYIYKKKAYMNRDGRQKSIGIDKHRETREYIQIMHTTHTTQYRYTYLSIAQQSETSDPPKGSSLQAFKCTQTPPPLKLSRFPKVKK